MRMAMDFIVHIVVLGVYTNVILSGNTSAVNNGETSGEVDEDLTKSEIFLAIYVTVSAHQTVIAAGETLPMRGWTR